MQKTKQDVLLGLVFFGTLAMLLWATAMLTDISLQPRQEVEVRFASAAGLKRGDPVFVVGTRNGQVLDVVYQPGAPLRIGVRLQFDSEVTFFRDAEIVINDSTLLGGKQIDIDPGTADERWPAGQALIGTTAENPLRALSSKLEGADIEGLVNSAKSVFDKVNTSQSSIGALINERTLYDDLAGAARSLRTSIEEIERGRGALGRAIHDVEMGQQVADAVAAIRDVVRNIQSGEGLLPRLLNDRQFGDDVAGILADGRALMRDLREGRGAVGKLLSDEVTAARVENFVQRIESIAGKIDDPQAGILGGLVGNADWHLQFERMLGDVSDFTWKMNNGEGLLSALVNDPELARRVSSMFRQVARAIEDAREAAPVGTFFQVLAGPF